MITTLLKSLFGSANDRYIKKLDPIIAEINEKEALLSVLSDGSLRSKTAEFKERLNQGDSLDDILPEAFAVVREASKRVLGMRHFDVQMKGAILLHRGMVTEMMTGEGKTLVATLPTYLNALTEKGVHVVTVNDYLAKRDSEWMGRIHEFLGLSVGCIVHDMNDQERQAAYQADITYGTNNEFGFDYLRDNMKFRREEMVQRPFNYAVVDEVDSILIDEARTPLIISGPAEDSSELYIQINKLIPKLSEEHYEKDEKARSITLTEAGSQKIETLLEESGLLKGGSLYDINNISLVHHVNQALKAHKIFTRDVDYIVKDRKVIIIDEFTGRMMEGRRYSEGLHQALEAKEKADIQVENQTLASITFQNYFRLYPKLSGMTGTAMTEATELSDIYKLEVIQVPTNLPMQRKDRDDQVYRTAREKYQAITLLIKECVQKGQPVLVGTTSIEKSDLLSSLLTKENIDHKVLNARYHEQEALIISQAGAPGAVTVATNMAGRGTDIRLGGNAEMRLMMEGASLTSSQEIHALEVKIKAEVKAAEAAVKAAGGLFVIGTERHESRRIDNQLRGRAGRQGDPGASQFFLSLEDDLMRIFGSDRLDNMLQKMGLEEGEAIVHKWINKALERAQQKVEARNYEIRKHLLKYDDVMNDQRKVIYTQRRDLMDTQDAEDLVKEMRQDVLENLINTCIPSNSFVDQWNLSLLHEEALRLFNLNLPIQSWAQEEGIAEAEIRDRIERALAAKMEGKERNYGSDMMRFAEKTILLQLLDQAWKDHLLDLDHLRQGINLRAYAQRDPLNEYKQEAFMLFESMLGRVREMTTCALCYLELQEQPTESMVDQIFPQENLPENLLGSGAELGSLMGPKALEEEKIPAPESTTFKTKKAVAEGLPTLPNTESRNAPCPCGSGKRFKHCHGKIV